jgi:4-amino-4-deoxy-L-arabinose transferase-like glycosyltransferase
MTMETPRIRRALQALVLLACLLRVSMIWLYPMPSIEAMSHLRGDGYAYFQVARSVVESGTFQGMEFKAYRPPGYPAFLALHLWVFGESTRAVQVTQNVLFLIAVGILAITARYLWGDLVGLICALLLLTNPAWLVLPQQAWSEALFVPLLCLTVSLSVWLVQRPSLPLALAVGVIVGLSALVREMGLYFGLFLAVLTGFTLWRHGAWPIGMRIGAMITVGILLAVAPWTCRNYTTFGTFVPLTTNSTINLYMGNNPEATGYMHWKLPDRVQEIWQKPSEGNANEIEAYRLCGQEAVAYMKSQPVKTVSRWPVKFWALWGPVPVVDEGSRFDYFYRVARWVHWPFFLALSCLGLWLLRREFLARLILGFLAMATFFHILTYGMPHYRTPYEVLLAIPAAFAITHFLSILRGKKCATNEGAAVPPPLRS